PERRAVELRYRLGGERRRSWAELVRELGVPKYTIMRRIGWGVFRLLGADALAHLNLAVSNCHICGADLLATLREVRVGAVNLCGSECMRELARRCARDPARGWRSPEARARAVASVRNNAPVRGGRY